MGNARVCRKFSYGFFKPNNTKQVEQQLWGETSNRLEGLVFEHQFMDQLRLTAPNTSTTGWIVVPAGNYFRWYRLYMPGEFPGRVDLLVESFLQSVGVDITRIYYTMGTPPARGRFVTHQASGDEPLIASLQRQFGRERRDVFEPQSRFLMPDRQSSAIAYLTQWLNAQQLERLSAHRLLINCYLNPWSGSQPIDIDAFVADADEVKLVEFKRKYPFMNEGSRGRYLFGLDESHTGLVRWFVSRGGQYLYLIWCDPLWREGKQRTKEHLLDDHSLIAPFARWIGAAVHPGMFTGVLASTYGADSGHGGGLRDQETLWVSDFHDLGVGRSPAELGSFLNGRYNAIQMTSDAQLLTDNRNALHLARNSARRSFS